MSAPKNPTRDVVTSPAKLSLRAFALRVAVALAMVAGLYLLWRLASVLLLAYASVLTAVLLRAVADPIRKHSGLGGAAALACAGALILALLGAAIWLAGSLVAAQIADLGQRLPQSMAELRRLWADLPFAGRLADELSSPASLASNLNGLAGRFGGYAVTAVGAIANLGLVLITGAFLAAESARARDGFLKLLPQRPREPIAEVLDASGQALRLWLLGTFADMVIVGTLTGIGAALVGLPSPAALGLLAGLAAFVPIVGTLTAALPGVLLAIQFGWMTVLWTVLMYVAVQQIEGNLIYPFIQRRATNLPPYLTLFSVLVFGVLFGGLGILLATPLLVVSITATKLLYQRRLLGEQVRLAAEA